MAGSAAVVVAGLGVGLAAYYSGGFQALSASTGPIELAYVPADSTVVAYADVRSIMNSELRQRLKASLPMPERGQEEFRAATGIDIENDIDYVVAAGTPSSNSVTGLVVARGRFETATLEKLAREHGAELQDYKGKQLLVLDPAAIHGETTTETTHKGVLAFLEPGLIAIGELTSVQRAIDAQLTAQSITSNNEMMELVSDIERANNAWAVGRFDVLARQAQLPEQVARQIPPVKWFAAAGHINGGISGSLRAEALDEKSAEQLRAVLNGFLALVQMQGQNDPKLNVLAQSLAVSGSGNTVSLSFTLPAEILELMVPKQPAVQ